MQHAFAAQLFSLFYLNYSFMKRLLLTTLTVWLLLLLAPGAVFAQTSAAQPGAAQPNATKQASASLQCCADKPICAGETVSLLVALEGQAPYTFRYSDGNGVHTVSTSNNNYELKVSPNATSSYSLVSMQDAKGAGQICGTATVAVNQCTPPASGKDCSDNCFDSQILKQETVGSCTTYTLKVTNDGSCSSALSHFSISVPCGRVTEASNSKGWPMEIGTTDPTTGITGIKVDNIKGFGENGKAGSFTVTYTICANACGASDPYCGFLVAYKAGTCVNYSTAAPPYKPMSGSLAATNIKCFSQQTGSIQLSLTGGKAPYTYSWSNGATTASLSNVAAGNYTLTITDAASKKLVLHAKVQQPEALVAQATATQTSCGNTNGSLSLQVSGGTAPYSYAWSNGAATKDINSLAAGTYSVTITDANNCSTTGSYTIAGSSTLKASLSGGSSCSSSLAITAEVSGGKAPYSYSWSNGATTASISPEEAGTYTLTVTDAGGCTTTVSTTSSGTSMPVIITYEYSRPSCANGRDAWIDLDVVGGSGSYTYSWSNGSTTEDLQNITSGSYTVTVTDALGCSDTKTISVPLTQPISVVATEIIQADCMGNLGGITVAASNGTAPYTYTWTHGATGESLEDLEPGYYTVTVTDDMGCTTSRTFQIKAPSMPQVQINGGSCGTSTLTAAASGGEGPYNYEWNTGATTGSINAEAGQYYTVTITDQNGCTASAEMQVDEIGSAITATTAVTQPGCFGSTNGSVDLTVDGGTGSYTYRWSNGATTEDLSNVGAGTYTVVITDESGCTKTATATIGNPAAITVVSELIHANCHGLGGISVEAQGGTAPYTYSWTHGPEGNSLDNLQAGQYTVVVTDARGCAIQKTFSIREEQAPAVSIANTGTCTTQQLTAQVSGSTGPYTYLWSSGQTTAAITPAVSGSYNVVVTDSNGCPAVAYTEVTLGESALILHADVQQASCSGTADASASIEVSGGTAPYTYDWSNGLGSAYANNLATGVYSVRVTDSKGCYDVVAFEIKQSAQIYISLLGGAPSICGQPNGSLTIEVEGGVAPYTYKWNTGVTSSTLQGVAAGSYTVAVIDAIGCSKEATFSVPEMAGNNDVAAILDDCLDTMIAAGNTASFAVNFSGNGPYTFSYTDGKQTYSVTTSANPYVLNVQPLKTTTYQLLSVSNSCGEGFATGKATATVVSPKTPACADGCFSTDLISTSNSGSCTTYTLKVNAGSDCRYDLSHFEVAVPCGQVSSMNNSKGWPMSVGLDPTTGVYGIKVDNIQGFGNNQSFTISYTLCNTESCSDSPALCGPMVAYKAGQCTYFGKATPPATGTPPVSDNPSYDGVLGPGMSLKLYPNPLMVGQTLTAEVENLFVSTTATVTIRTLAGLKVYEQTQAVSPSNNKVQLSVPALLQGNYLVSVSIYNSHYTKQLVIY
ncbi:gliding motility-like protein [Flammeovirgaceae bacterium 311]|nr:gliding motility-like protein [Flammeovirgaceae bacterium 311]